MTPIDSTGHENIFNQLENKTKMPESKPDANFENKKNF